MTLGGNAHEINWVYDYAPGWRSLLVELREALEELPVEVRVSQCKEKFGGLRLYYELPAFTPDGLARRVDELVNAAELRTYEICFVCGAPQTHVGSGWWTRYFCAAHDTVDLRRD